MFNKMEEIERNRVNFQESRAHGSQKVGGPKLIYLQIFPASATVVESCRRGGKRFYAHACCTRTWAQHRPMMVMWLNNRASA